MAYPTDDCSTGQLQEWSHNCHWVGVQWRVWFLSHLCPNKRSSLSYTGH